MMDHDASALSYEVKQSQPEAVSVTMSQDTETGKGGSVPEPSETVVFAHDARFERRLIRKIDLLTVPMMILVYFLCFLDRTNIGNAKLLGLQKTLDLTDATYRIALTILYVPYIVLEIPSNLVVKRVGPHIYLPTLLTIWGIISTLQGIVKSQAGLFANRFFLGAVEAGIVPAIILYFSSWFKRDELQVRIGYFWAAASLSGAVSGLLAAAISNLSGTDDLQGWSWIFIVEGIVTVACGLASFFTIPKSPSEARFLSPEQRAYAVQRLQDDAAHAREVTIDGQVHHLVVDDEFSWKAVWSVFADPQTYFLAVIGFCSGTNVYSVAYFLPTVLAGFTSIATTTVITQLLTVPPYTVGVITTLVACWYSDKYRFRYPALALSALVAIVGIAILYAARGVGVKYFGVHLAVAGIYTSVPTYLTWAANNYSGHYRRATGVATVFVFTNSGGILSTWLFQASQAPGYRTAYIINLSFLCLYIVAGTCLTVHYHRQNKIRDSFVRDGRSDEYGSGKNGDRHVFFRYVR